MGNRINFVVDIDIFMDGEALWQCSESDECREERWRLMDIIWQCIKDEHSNLTEKQRECLMLYLEGRNKSEIAKIMGNISPSSVAKHINTAIKNIKIYIKTSV